MFAECAGHKSLDVADYVENEAVVLDHLLVVAAALRRRPALDMLAHHYVNLHLFLLNLRRRKQRFVGFQKVHIVNVLLKFPERNRKPVLFAL